MIFLDNPTTTPDEIIEAWEAGQLTLAAATTKLRNLGLRIEEIEALFAKAKGEPR